MGNSLANPREGTQDRDDHQDVGDDARGNDRVVLDAAMPKDVDNLENQPATRV